MGEKRYASISEAIQNGLGTLVSRIFIVVGMPAILGMGSYIGYQVVDKLDKLVERVDRQHDGTVRDINRLDVRMTGVERDVEHLRSRQ